MAAERHAEPLGDRLDHGLEHGVVEGRDLAGRVIHRVVMMVRRVGVGDLEARDPVAAVEAMQQAELEQAIEHPIDGRARPDAASGDLVDHLLGGQQALSFTSKELHHRAARLAQTQPCRAHPTVRFLQPAFTRCRIHGRDDTDLTEPVPGACCPLWRRPFVSRMIDHPPKEAELKYAMLIYPKPSSDDGLGEEEAKALSAEYLALRADSRCVGGAHLQPADMATTVRHGGAENLITDGPFADAKEVLGGYYVFEASNLDAALEFAQRIPAVRLGGAVEVRPLVEIPMETAH